MSLYGLVHKFVICRKCFLDVEAHEKRFLDEHTAFQLLLRHDKSSRIQKIQIKIIETSNFLHSLRLLPTSSQQISPNVSPCAVIGEWEGKNERCAQWLRSIEVQPKAPLEFEAAEQLEAQEFSEEARQAVMEYRSEVAAALPEPKIKALEFPNSVQRSHKAAKKDMQLGPEKAFEEVLSGSSKSAEKNANFSNRTSQNDKFSKAKETSCTSYTKIFSRGKKLDECSKNTPENRQAPKEEIKQGVGKTSAEVLTEPKNRTG
ncbi:bce4a418-e839-4ee8-819a-b2acc7753db0 [Sclerotinia trifoliorum]|uniref:Bce4a418-e839-4ee8-819a-b2acc7753db0 n=1 Tax=Sclerotinia trifoliorum TaxID=28548 RepID=A0A8H2VSG3_9HELO|nr:bce4a418-e839-4ee8-819a-b2acc7753db0 [Sclerotinia trifoliorum]